MASEIVAPQVPTSAGYASDAGASDWNDIIAQLRILLFAPCC